MALCCVKGCKNRGEKRSKTNSGVSYHLFPRDTLRRARWMAALSRENWHPSNASVVCSDHFEESCFYTTNRGLKRLLDDAVPSISISILKESANEDPESASDVENYKHPKTIELAIQLHRLNVIYDKQKKKIRTLRQRLKRSKERLYVTVVDQAETEHICQDNIACYHKRNQNGSEDCVET